MSDLFPVMIIRQCHAVSKSPHDLVSRKILCLRTLMLRLFSFTIRLWPITSISALFKAGINKHEWNVHHQTTNDGAEKRTAKVDTKVKVTLIHRQSRSMTVAANRHSQRSSISSSSLRHLYVILFNSLSIDINSGLELITLKVVSLWFGIDVTIVPFSNRISSSVSMMLAKRFRDCWSCTIASLWRERSTISFWGSLLRLSGFFISRRYANHPLIYFFT